jgi:AmmeMemoRadiSam system protein B
MHFDVRPAAVAGLFYPEEGAELWATVERLLAAAAEPPPGPRPKAIIAPHAGYPYSGPIAASAFRALTAAAAAGADGEPPIERVVVLGPSHYVPFDGVALPGSPRFATPLGEMEIDPMGSRAALRLPQVRVMPAAHEREHSIEVELPFLRVALGEVRIVALVVGRADPGEVAEVLDAVWGGPETAIVVSSDLSHYLPYDRARETDRATADQILALREPLDPRQACGAAPINGLLRAARERGMAAELLDLRSSADTAGDPSRVVGYGAFAFHARALHE